VQRRSPAGVNAASRPRHAHLERRSLQASTARGIARDLPAPERSSATGPSDSRRSRRLAQASHRPEAQATARSRSSRAIGAKAVAPAPGETTATMPSSRQACLARYARCRGIGTTTGVTRLRREASSGRIACDPRRRTSRPCSRPRPISSRCRRTRAPRIARRRRNVAARLLSRKARPSRADTAASARNRRIVRQPAEACPSIVRRPSVRPRREGPIARLAAVTAAASAAERVQARAAAMVAGPAGADGHPAAAPAVRPEAASC